MPILVSSADLGRLKIFLEREKIPEIPGYRLRENITDGISADTVTCSLVAQQKASHLPCFHLIKGKLDVSNDRTKWAARP